MNGPYLQYLRRYFDIQELKLDISEWAETFTDIIYEHYQMVDKRIIVWDHFLVR